MLVTGRELMADNDLATTIRAVRAAVRGGVNIVQLREKDLPQPQLEEWAKALRSALPPDVPLVLNGSPALALSSGANGYHLPESAAIPEPMDDSLLRGRSVHSLHRAMEVQYRCDYLIAGSIFDTSSHPGQPGRGLPFLRQLCSVVSTPVVAIGGIQPDRVGECLQAGAAGIAVRSSILAASNPEEAAHHFQQALQGSILRIREVDTLIKVMINGREREIQPAGFVADLLRAYDLNPAMVVVERNGVIVPRPRYNQEPVEANDCFEVVQMMAGG
jgi:thiamine-phosphate pyrophosphorylase